MWAIDGAWLDAPVGSSGRRALIVVEMESKGVLALRSVPGERASAAIECLEQLVEQHGAPLVLKLDNGSAFIAARMAAFAQKHGIVLLHSPVRRPSYNGTCEVSGRWAKRRAMAAAIARDAPGSLLPEDLDAAVTWTGAMPRIDHEARKRFLATVDEQLQLAAAERGLVLGDQLEDHARRSLTRVAARRALELCHILTIEGRAFPCSLPARKAS